MSGIKDQDRLEELRQRLYERGKPTAPTPSHQLTDDPKPVPEKWEKPPEPKQPVPTVAPANKDIAAVSTSESATLYPVKKRRGYRLKLILVGLVFFVLSVGLSSLFLIQGNNVISGDKITLAVTGPFTIGGGEIIPVQVGITNDNTVAIQSATLVVNYPEGTRSPTEGKDLFSERLPLENIGPGETVNIPIRALVFGEENDEREIGVTIQYRVEGSNALLTKDADPLRFKISSTPITLNTVNSQRVSSGQETDVVITVTSNSPTPLSEILVKADYPTVFDFVRADPEPSLAQNMWLIDSIEPEESKTITLTGILFGRETEEHVINLTVGVPAERSPQDLASVFVTDQVEFVIEQPFIDIGLEVNNQSGEAVVVEPDNQFNATINVENTLEDTIYDTVIVATLTGNALNEIDVDVRDGYYNSSNNTITWDGATLESLKQITPGDNQRVGITVVPNDDTSRTPQIGIDVTVEAKRVSENRVAESLSGGASTVVRIQSEPTILSDIGFNNSVFTDTGPIPPEADTPTSYTMSLMIENGSNEIADTTITASVPPYVRWLDQTSGSGVLTFNPVTREVTWDAGTVEANATVFANFQVSFLPSRNQIGKTPTLLGEQRLKATDRFTGSTVRATTRALTTELSAEAGFDNGNGRVVEGE